MMMGYGIVGMIVGLIIGCITLGSFPNHDKRFWVCACLACVVFIGSVILMVTVLADMDKAEYEQRYQLDKPYLDSLSCDDLKDVIHYSNNSTLVSHAKENVERCLP